MRPEGYLSVERSGVDWLIDPDHPRMRSLGEDLRQRTPDSPVDHQALLEDIPLLRRLIAERHVFAVLGRCAPDAADQTLAHWSDRLRANPPATWGEAVGDVVPRLREALGDNHLAMSSDTTTRPARPAQAADPGPAWATSEVGGVSVVRIRTFTEDPDSTAALTAGSQDRSPFADDRMIVDLRGNGGGDDGFAQRWMAPMVHTAVTSPTIRCLSVGASPVMVWNYLAFQALRHPEAPPPAALLPLRHTPSAGDELEVRDAVDQIPVGQTPWGGRMLIVVDGGTASSGESAAWMLRQGFQARIVGGRTLGLFESANLCPYVLPHSGLTVLLPSQWVQTPEPVEFVGLTPEVDLDVQRPVEDLARDFDQIWAAAG